MNRVLSVGASFLAIAVSVFLFSRFLQEQKASEDFPEGTFWLCQGGPHEFVKTIDELGAWYAKNLGNPPCPICGGQDTARAYRCMHQDCRRFFVAAIAVNGKAGCPMCRRELGTVRE